MKFEKISADEAQNLRKDVINDRGVMAKGVPVVPEVTRAAKFNEETRTAHFVMSAEVADRMGDIVMQEGLDTVNFEANPQALLFHNSRNWPIGKWANVQKSLAGRPKRTEGDMILLAEGDDPDADRAAKHLKAGTMRTVSIGFRPDWKEIEGIKDDEGHWTGIRFHKSELLECSLVPIPALPAATMKELSVGMLSAESKELIKGILENFSLKDGEVLDRELLETAVREADGNRTFVTVKLDATGWAKGVDDMKATIDRFVAEEMQKAGDPPAAPGETPPVAPNPGDDETAKSQPFVFKDGVLTVAGLSGKFIEAKAEVPEVQPAEADANRKAVADIDVILREAKDQETLLTRALRALLPTRAKAEAPAEPSTPPAPAPVDEERRAAALAQASELREAGQKLVA